MSIADNLKQIDQEIKKAKAKSPHPSEMVTVVIVSKKHTIEELREVIPTGNVIFGENRVQELLDKYPAFIGQAEWHLIGHLQQNKVKYIIDKVQLIHSVDSLQLINEINRRAMAADKIIDILLQVNIAAEATKFGLQAKEVLPILEQMSNYPHVQVRGLMNIAPNYEDKEQVRPIFRQMYQLFCHLKALSLPQIKMEILSMGMSGDFVIAVEEGANMVRIGSRVFAKSKNEVN